MSKIIIEDEKSAVDYIQSVLSEWDSWESHHVLLVQALEILLKIHQRKASEVAREIFEEIDSLLEIDEKDFDEVFEQSRSEDEDNVSLALSNYVYGIRHTFAELKKKYTGERE